MINAHVLAKNASDAAEDSKPSVIEIGVVNRAIERTCNGRFIRSNRKKKNNNNNSTQRTDKDHKRKTRENNNNNDGNLMSL